jgi:hypothetical protein
MNWVALAAVWLLFVVIGVLTLRRLRTWRGSDETTNGDEGSPGRSDPDAPPPIDLGAGLWAMFEDIRKGWRHGGVRGVVDEAWTDLVVIGMTLVAAISLVLVLIIWR